MGLHGPYKPRKFNVGERLLALRTRSELTQTELAELIGASRRSVQGWEAGATYPQEDKLRQLITVFLAKGVLTPGQEHEEAFSLWQQVSQDAGHRLAHFDEKWFATLLVDYHQGNKPGVAPEPLDPSTSTNLSNPQLLIQDRVRAPFVDWGEAPDVSLLYGREVELTTLQQWVIEDHCRVVALLGLGGIGKTSLAVSFAKQAAASSARSAFDLLLFRSLKNGPPLAQVLDQSIRAISNQQVLPPESLADKIALLVQLFRRHRCLLILDNFETLLQSGTLTGTFRSENEDYALLLNALAEREHKSCLLLTSREKPSELLPIEGRTAPVRTLQLAGLAEHAGQLMLEAKELMGTAKDLQAVVRLYGGNPLALNLVAAPIREIFGGDVATFLMTDHAFFNDMIGLLDQQFARSTMVEQRILYWLAIAREPVPFNELVTIASERVPKREVLRALESLRRRMWIELSSKQPAFTLQPVVLEYITEQLVESVCQEVVDSHPNLLSAHALVQATAKEYIRHIQERLIASSLLERLGVAFRSANVIEFQLLKLLEFWRSRTPAEHGYGPGNVVNLLRLLHGHLRGLDLNQLVIRQAYLQGVEVHDTILASAVIQDCIFTETFDAMTAVAISPTGEHWAAGGRRGEVLVWAAGGHFLHRGWRAHTDMIPTLNFSPDGRALATAGGWRGSVKLWDVARGRLLWSGRHRSHVNAVQFSPDGRLLASSGDDATVRLWDVQSGKQMQVLPHPAPVAGITWNPDGTLLASGDGQGTIRIWEIQDNAPPHCLSSFTGHDDRIDSLTFAPDGNMLASASWDGTVKLWDSSTARTGAQVGRQVRQTLTGHTSRVTYVAWSPDGHTLASCSRDRTLRLWDVEDGVCRLVLQGHGNGVYGLAFTPDSQSLLSSSEDGTLRVWDVATGLCLRVIHGHSNALYAVDWSPDGTQLVSGGTDRMVTIYAVDAAQSARILQGHSGIVLGVGWSPDGRQLASSEWDNAIRVWDATTGISEQLLQHCDDTSNYFSTTAWSPDGKLACTTYRHGVLVWDTHTQSRHWLDHQRPTWIRTITWSSDGRQLATGDEYGTVYLWNADDHTLLRELASAHNTVMCLAWEPEGARLVSGGWGKGGGELFVWDTVSGERLHTIAGHPVNVCAVAWGSQRDIVISGDSEGILRWWNLQNGNCLRVQEAHAGSVQSLRRSPDGTKLASCGDDGTIQIWDLDSGNYLQILRRDRPYERMQIDGLAGITEAQRASLLALGAVERSDSRSLYGRI